MTLARLLSTSEAKWVTKSSSGSDQMGQRRRRRASAKQSAKRFALVETEGGDIDERHNVRRIRAQRGDDLPPVGVAGDDGRAALPPEDLAQTGDVGRKRSLGELRRCDGKP